MTLETFKIEVLPLKDKLFRFANRMLRNIPEAEDIVQEVMIRLWNRRTQLNEYKSIEAFAMVITKNLCLDKLKLKSNKSTELNEKHEQVIEKTPYSNTELMDSYDKIKNLIEKLPEQQKLIIHLRDIEGYDYEEISGIMNMSENTIRVNLSRARKTIREKMTKMYSYEFTKN